MTKFIHKVSVASQLKSRYKWCLENFGEEGNRWDHIYSYEDRQNLYRFSSKDDYTLFLLTWKYDSSIQSAD